MAELREILLEQVASTKEIAEELFCRYSDVAGLKKAQGAIEELSKNVNCRLYGLDQTVRDLLQIMSYLISAAIVTFRLTSTRNLLRSLLLRLTNRRASQQA